MSADPSQASAPDAATVESWRRAAARAPAIGLRVRLLQLAWVAIIAVGALPTLAIIRVSLLSGYWLGLLNVALHLAAILWGLLGTSREGWFGAPGQDLLPLRAARAHRLTMVRRVVMVEAGVLLCYAPIKSLLLSVPLRWWWPATLSIGVFLISFALERIFRAEWREHQRLAHASPLED